MEPNSVAVEIMGRTYTIRSYDDKAYITKLGKLVNDKMVEVERASKTVDSVRAAVLAALNLADEFHKREQAYQHRILELEAERASMAKIVDEALALDAKVSDSL